MSYLRGTPTFIGLYRALASYCPIVLLSYRLIVLLPHYLIYLNFVTLFIQRRTIIALLLYNSVG